MSESKKPKGPRKITVTTVPEYRRADVFAIQALANGNANEHQQKRALRWIIENACATYDLPWWPGAADGDRASSFSAGRMFAGQQIVKLIKINPEIVKE